MTSPKSTPKKETRKGRKIKHIIITIIAITLLWVGSIGYKYYNYIFEPNVIIPDSTETLIFIPSDSSFSAVTDILENKGYLKDTDGFEWVAQKKNYSNSVIGGCYTLKHNMNNNDLVNLLRSGRQTPVKITFNNIRTLEQLAGRIANRIEPDSLELTVLLNDSSIIAGYGFNKKTFIAMFIPNTYEFYWTTSAKKFIERMNREYKLFWNDIRVKKAKVAGMTAIEVNTLASIVDEETIKADEKAVVAGLYINRLNKGMRLQADPTIKFVIGDFTVKRILNKDLKIDSPYNTYLYSGLPPGPIRIPSIQGIDAVLNYKKHKYLYMCAKEDFSGYHNFAKTLKQHNQNAARYRKALRKNRIWR